MKTGLNGGNLLGAIKTIQHALESSIGYPGDASGLWHRKWPKPDLELIK